MELLSTYLLINIGIILFPLLFSFEKRIHYVSSFPALLRATLLVGAFFVTWDVLATSRGDWWFNPIHTLGFPLFGLPLEEILFFITVPYSCLFVWEAIVHLGPKIKPNIGQITNHLLPYLASLGLLILSFIFIAKPYTFTALFVAGIVLFLTARFTPFLTEYRYYIFLTITLFLFIIFNFILTSIPIVLYNPTAIVGLRFTTIPLEDFLFNFSLLTCYLIVFEQSKKKSNYLPTPVSKRKS